MEREKAIMGGFMSPVVQFSSKQNLFQCCLCGQVVEEFGNNPEPIMSGKCCDACNLEYVIPVRNLWAELVDVAKEANPAWTGTLAWDDEKPNEEL